VMTFVGPYAWVNHHGIWISPDGTPVDVTPFPNTSKDQPTLDEQGRVVFAPDDGADPWIAPNILGTLSQRSIALGDKPRAELVAWLKERDENDRRRIQAEIANALDAGSSE
jgi:hypothetical protein